MCRTSSLNYDPRQAKLIKKKLSWAKFDQEWPKRNFAENVWGSKSTDRGIKSFNRVPCFQKDKTKQSSAIPFACWWFWPRGNLHNPIIFKQLATPLNNHHHWFYFRFIESNRTIIQLSWGRGRWRFGAVRDLEFRWECFPNCIESCSQLLNREF